MTERDPQHLTVFDLVPQDRIATPEESPRAREFFGGSGRVEVDDARTELRGGRTIADQDDLLLNELLRDPAEELEFGRADRPQNDAVLAARDLLLERVHEHRGCDIIDRSRAPLCGDE